MRRILPIIAVSSLLLVTDVVLASQTGSSSVGLGTLAKNAASANTDFRDMFLSFATLAGIFLCMLSLFLFYQESKQPNQGNMKKGIYALVIGVGLLSLEFIAGAGKSQLTNNIDDPFNGQTPFSGSIDAG